MAREYVRAKEKDTGYHVSILAEQFNPDTHTRLKQAAVDEHGRPLPPDFDKSPSAVGRPAANPEES